MKYTSRFKAALSIATEEKSNSTVRGFVGSEPPQEIVESELPADVDYVEVDGTEVWSRETFSDKAKKFGLIDDDEIPF